MKLRKKTTVIAASACTIFVINASQGQVMVTFEQVNFDVIATWSGSINPGDFIGDFIALNDEDTASSNSILSGRENSYVDYWGGGTATTTSLIQSYIDRPSGMITYGFTSVGYFYFPGQYDNMPNNNIVTFDSSYTIVWPNQTLSSIGASNFNNTLAFTTGAGGNNTISYTTIPEPSSLLLVTSSAFFLLRRRR